MERPELTPKFMQIPAGHIPDVEFHNGGLQPILNPSRILRMPYNTALTRAKKHYAKAMYELALATYWTAKDTEAKAVKKKRAQKV